MMQKIGRKVLIGGHSGDEILGLPNEQLDQFVFCDEPTVFRVGSAEILGSFQRTPDRIILELAHIDDGGEGALPILGALASRYAARESLMWEPFFYPDSGNLLLHFGVSGVRIRQ